MVRTRKQFAAERVSLLRDQSEAERLQICMGELVKTVEATPVERKVKPTENSVESEVGDTENSVVKREVDETKNSALEGEVESTKNSIVENEVESAKNSGESEAGDTENSVVESEGE